MPIKSVVIDTFKLPEESKERVILLNNAIADFNEKEKPNLSDFLPIVEHFHEVLKDVVENQKGDKVFGAPVNDILKGFKSQLPMIGQCFTDVKDIQKIFAHIKGIELLGQNLAAAAAAPAPSTSTKRSP